MGCWFAGLVRLGGVVGCWGWFVWCLDCSCWVGCFCFLGLVFVCCLIACLLGDCLLVVDSFAVSVDLLINSVMHYTLLMVVLRLVVTQVWVLLGFGGVNCCVLVV